MLMHGCVKGQSDLRGPKFAGSALIRREDQIYSNLVKGTKRHHSGLEQLRGKVALLDLSKRMKCEPGRVLFVILAMFLD